MFKLNKWLIENAKKYPNKLAIIYEEDSLTYKNLQDKVHDLSKRLPSIKRVGVYIDNSLKSAVLIHSLIERHIEIVMINTRLSAEEINNQLNDVDVDTIFSTIHSGVLDEVEAKVFDYNALLNLKEIEYEIFDANDEDILSIMFTSGTTGRPKAVTQTYLNHYASHLNAKKGLKYDSNSTWLMVNPIFHISGFSILMRAIISGCTLIIHNKFDTKHVLDVIEQQKVTHTSFVPVMLSRIMSDENVRKKDLSSLQAILMGGANTTPKLLKCAIELDLPVYNSFGMTETCSQIVIISHDDEKILSGTVGKVNENIHINEEGELLVKGKNVTNGYLNAKINFEDEFFNTGDIAAVEDGYLYILDRRDDLIISGGENIYPKEIEDVVLKYTDLNACVVVKKDDEEWGQVPVLIVEENVSNSTLKSLFNKHLARFKHPKEVIIVNEIKYTPSGKISRKLNRETYID